jgi:hypothetical protein
LLLECETLSSSDLSSGRHTKLSVKKPTIEKLVRLFVFDNLTKALK